MRSLKERLEGALVGIRRLEQEKAVQGGNIRALMVEQNVVKGLVGCPPEEQLEGFCRKMMAAEGAEAGAEVVALATKKVDEIAAERDALAEQLKSCSCAYCGESISNGGEDDLGKITAHVMSCPEHPLKEVVAERDLAQKQVCALMKSVKVAGAARGVMERQLAGLRRMLEQERGLVRDAGCVPWVSPKTVVPTEGTGGLRAENEALTRAVNSAQEGHRSWPGWQHIATQLEQELAAEGARVRGLRVESKELKQALEVSIAEASGLSEIVSDRDRTHGQVVADLKAAHALNQDALRKNHENEMAGLRQMLEQERALVRAAACGPWMSPKTVAPTEGMVALLEMKEGDAVGGQEGVEPWRLEFGFYDGVRRCWWTSIGQQNEGMVVRMAVVVQGNLCGDIQEMLRVAEGAEEALAVELGLDKTVSTHPGASSTTEGTEEHGKEKREEEKMDTTEDMKGTKEEEEEGEVAV